VLLIVIASAARNLLFVEMPRKQQIPRRFAPRNDSLKEFFNKLLMCAMEQAPAPDWAGYAYARR